MSSNTPNLGLLKKDPMVDGNETFNIETMLNENWDKVDEAVGQVREDLGNIDVDIPEASLTEKGIVQLSSATNGTRENVAATEKAVKAAYDEALAGKQLGVEQKANVVAALNSIGVAASTSEIWSQLVAKMAGVIKATGNATAGDVLAGQTFSNGSGNGLIGEMINRSAEYPAVDYLYYSENRNLYIKPPAGYYPGGITGGWTSEGNVYINDPAHLASNIREGVSLFGVIGNLVEGTQYLTWNFPSNPNPGQVYYDISVPFTIGYAVIKSIGGPSWTLYYEDENRTWRGSTVGGSGIPTISNRTNQSFRLGYFTSSGAVQVIVYKAT